MNELEIYNIIKENRVQKLVGSLVEITSNYYSSGQQQIIIRGIVLNRNVKTGLSIKITDVLKNTEPEFELKINEIYRTPLCDKIKILKINQTQNH